MSRLPQTEPLWRPKNPENTPIARYRQHINRKFGKNFKNSHELQRWSVSKAGRQDFWLDLWSYVGMVPALPSNMKEAYDNNATIDQNPRWFEGVNINYAENVLEGRDPNAVALIGLREGEPIEGEKWTWQRLRENVRKARSALLRLGVKREDRVGAIMSNSNWIIALFLACASIGVVYTSISPDMGLEGCVSRLQQVEPVVVFADSCQTYKGKKRSLREKIASTIAALPRIPKVYLIPLGGAGETLDYPVLDDFLAQSSPEDELTYLRVPFSAPLVILYSSGTSGPPKCIVHQHGIILQLKKIAKLHNSLTESDVVFQFSSTSWVLWNIMNGHLSVGATVVCYDGSPLYPDASTKLKVLEHHKCTYFGTSPRYLLELEMSGIKPKSFNLSKLRMVTTTGATLTAEQFRWFYTAFPRDIHLSSVAGGTEICTSWMASDPSAPVYAAEMQLPALGQDVDVGDPETGESIKDTGEAGELICRSPFPSMPIYFYGDKGGKKYHEAYFERYSHIKVWAQHDWIQFNPKTGGAQIHGRSDGTLNPSGIRFGSSEIYNIVESPRFNSRIGDTLCVGRKRKHDQDEVVFLFVKMKEGHVLTEQLKKEVENAIRTLLSPRHVPRFILQVKDIPVTINGKKVEIVVKKIISGTDVKVSSTVANPECLDEYKKYRDIEHTRMSKL
ncbi:acetoacetate-CoA ligase [Verruconis gallopava]|uniref:Acetoacetate-CoA ligase n=1 Tax=Verruconis gallopava TaxID=253628 RepID=A0A0D2A7H0_9PEZI|nr:acetoacetate-CoA ligase [Verruconis gallopava]KIW02698.1 acetoacetate-CoA ligase [Verruconis gallopava]